MTRYIAKITPLNEEKIGTGAHGEANINVKGDKVIIKIDMEDTPKNIQHWEHFHGFIDGSKAHAATMKDDANGDGFIDLLETEKASGTTMVPFDNAPHEMNIPNDSYPISDDYGRFSYVKEISLKSLTDKFNSVFNNTGLNFENRVIYVHGVPEVMNLPESVSGQVGNYDNHVTLPIAVGEFQKVED